VHAPNIDQLILDIHAAPLDENRWPAVLDSVRRAVGAHQAMLFSLPKQSGEAFWRVLSECDPAMTLEYAQEFAVEDSWWRASRRFAGPLTGRVFTGEELLPRSDFLHTRFFNEFLRQYDIDRFMTNVLRDSKSLDGTGANLSLYRGYAAEAFFTSERELLTRLSPHLRTALNTFCSIQALSLRSAALSGTLEKITAALFVLDRTGAVMFENAAARRELRTGDLLTTSLGRLEPAPGIREARECRDVLRGLLAGRSSTVRLTALPRGRATILTTAPLSGAVEVLGMPRSGAGIVWLIPTAQTRHPTARMGHLFELTQAEERLLAALSCGQSLNEAAAAFHISVHTARSQLKSLQRKTGWRTQTELVRMMQQASFIDPEMGSEE
jgi:DNA-binding CsgD family transcriptional regulator